VDGSSFKASEAEDALEAWQVALSFALWRWIALVAPVGFDVDGKPVWEQWGSWRCSPAYRYIPWWATEMVMILTPGLPAPPTQQIAPSSPQPVHPPAFGCKVEDQGDRSALQAADLDRLQLLGCNQPARRSGPEHVGRLGGDHERFMIVLLFLLGRVPPQARIKISTAACVG
jgi:hypothetical protein